MAKDTAYREYRAGTPVNLSQVAKDTAHKAQHTKRSHR